MALRQYKDEIKAKYESGQSVADLATEYGCKESTMKSNLKVWGITEFTTNAERMYCNPAPLTRHRREIVVVGDKPMLDITDYVIDCGGNTSWEDEIERKRRRR